MLWNCWAETKASDIAGPIRAEAPSPSLSVPYFCRAKSLFGTRKSPGVIVTATVEFQLPRPAYECPFYAQVRGLGPRVGGVPLCHVV